MVRVSIVYPHIVIIVIVILAVTKKWQSYVARTLIFIISKLIRECNSPSLTSLLATLIVLVGPLIRRYK